MATFPGKPPNPLGVKVELLGIVSAGVWTDITALYVMLRDKLVITNMGRADESSGIGPSQLTLTLKNTDGRFTPKNAAGAYYPNIVRNCQVRVSVNATSSTGVAYNQFRFFGEVASWPPASSVSGRDLYVQVTASGIWQRVSQSSAAIGSPYTRYLGQLTGTSVPATAWAMEDGNNSTSFVTEVGAGAAATFSGAPSFAADGTSFAGCDALPQFNGARVTCNPSSAATPTNVVVRFALAVPAAGDSNVSSNFAASGSGPVAQIVMPSGTGMKRCDVDMVANKLVINGYAATGGGTPLFTGTVATKVNGTPVLVSVELTPSGSSINWALRIIKPGAGAALDQSTGTKTSVTLAAVTIVYLNAYGRLSDTTCGQLGVFYAVPSLVTAATAIGGFAGEFAVDRFNRICGEFGIASTVIGSTSAAMGPQPDDTLANVLQQVEDTDGGLLYEPRDSFGLGYRTLLSMQNQASPVVLNYAGGILGDSTGPLRPVYDLQLVRNQWLVTNSDGYVAQATLTSGAISVAAVPNGVGVYSGTASTNASTHAQVNAIATQRLFQGTVDEVRYPTVMVNMARVQAAPLFATVPGLRVGDYLQVTNVPATMGGTATSKQLTWGYSETIGANSWTIVFNTVPETPFETGFSPGVYSVVQAPAAGVAGGSAGSGLAGAQIGSGAVGGGALAATLSARSVGGVTSFISAATPYDWTFAVTGTPADVGYFTCTEEQALPIYAGDTFTNSGGLGGPFTVTSLDPPAAGLVNVHYTPDASGVMSSGTNTGGKNGDTWINTSGGQQINQWTNGAWVPIAFNAVNVIQANTINATLLAAGIVYAGIVDATTIQALQYIASGTSGEFLVYNGTPAFGNLITSISPVAGTDAYGNAYPAYLGTGYAYFANSSTPSTSPGVSLVFSDTAGYLRFKPDSNTGDTNVYEIGAVQLFAKNTSQAISSTTPATITGLSCTVGTGTYHIRGRVQCTQGGTAAVQNFRFSGPAITDGRIVATSFANGASVGHSWVNNIASTFLTSGQAFGSGAVWTTYLDGWYQFSASGTLALQAAEGTNLDTFTVVDGILEVIPAI